MYLNRIFGNKQGPLARLLTRPMTIPILLVISFCSVWLGAVEVRGGEGAPWLTGRELDRRLEQPTSVSWKGRELRAGINGLSLANRVAIILDRRVDPGQTIDLSISREPLANVLQQVAASAGLETTMVGPAIYVGPIKTATRLKTLLESRKQEAPELPIGMRRRFERAAPMSWDVLTSPRQILQELQDEASIELRSMESVPHDLWPSAEFPPMTLIERLTLVLAGFDFTFHFTNDGAEIVPIPDEVFLEKSYPGGFRPAEKVMAWRKLVPAAEIRLYDGKIVVRGLWEDHERLLNANANPAKARNPRQNSDVPRGRKVYRLTVHIEDEPLEDVLQALARRLEFQLDIDRDSIRAIGVSLRELVVCHVDNADVDVLFQAILDPLGLSFRITGRTVHVYAEAE